MRKNCDILGSTKNKGAILYGFNIRNSYAFMLLIIIGYVAGITAKIVTGQTNYVLAAYVLNLAIVLLNLVIYFRNSTLDKKKA